MPDIWPSKLLTSKVVKQRLSFTCWDITNNLSISVPSLVPGLSKVFTVMQLKMYNSVSELSLDQLINMWCLSAGAAEESLFNDRKRTSTRVDTLLLQLLQGKDRVVFSPASYFTAGESRFGPWTSHGKAIQWHWPFKNRVLQNILPCCLSWKHRMLPKDDLLGVGSRTWHFYIDPLLSSKPYFEYLGLWRFMMIFFSTDRTIERFGPFRVGSWL